MKLDSTLIARNFFEEAFRSVSDVHLIDTSEEPAVGAFQWVNIPLLRLPYDFLNPFIG